MTMARSTVIRSLAGRPTDPEKKGSRGVDVEQSMSKLREAMTPFFEDSIEDGSY